MYNSTGIVGELQGTVGDNVIMSGKHGVPLPPWPEVIDSAGWGSSKSQQGGEDALDSDLPILDSVLNYEKINRIGEGTYGVVCELPENDTEKHRASSGS